MNISTTLEILIGSIAIVMMLFRRSLLRTRWFIIGVLLVIIIISFFSERLEAVINSGWPSTAESLQAQPHRIMGFSAYIDSPGKYEISAARIFREPDNDMKYQINLPTLLEDPKFTSTGIKINFAAPINLNERDVQLQVQILNSGSENISSAEILNLMEEQLFLVVRDYRDEHFTMAFDTYCEYDNNARRLNCKFRGKDVSSIEREKITSLEFHLPKFTQPLGLKPEADGLILLTISDIRFTRP